MSRRNKSRPRGAQPNTEAVSVQDAFSNPLFRLGYGSQSPLEATEYPLTRMTDNYALLNSLYRDNWVVQNVVGIIPNVATNKRSLRRSGGAGAPEGTGSRSVRDGAPGAGQRGTAVGQAVRRRRRTYHDPRTGGDAGPATGAGEHLPRYLPRAFDTDRRAGVPGMESYSRAESHARLLPITDARGNTVAKVHHSRLVRFTGRDLPFLERVAELYWGESEVEALT